MANDKFRGMARNSAAHRKLWVGPNKQHKQVK